MPTCSADGCDKRLHADNRSGRCGLHRTQATPEGRDGYLRRRYGITLAERTALLASQGGMCAGCGGGPLVFIKGRTGATRTGAHVDHDHVTGKVRGILCGRCNLALGYYESVLPWAADYLEKSRGT